MAESMLMEIVDNAIHATKMNHRERLVAIRLHQAAGDDGRPVDGSFAMTVTDNGIAMDHVNRHPA